MHLFLVYIYYMMKYFCEQVTSKGGIWVQCPPMVVCHFSLSPIAIVVNKLLLLPIIPFIGSFKILESYLSSLSLKTSTNLWSPSVGQHLNFKQLNHYINIYIYIIGQIPLHLNLGQPSDWRIKHKINQLIKEYCIF